MTDFDQWNLTGPISGRAYGLLLLDTQYNRGAAAAFIHDDHQFSLKALKKVNLAK